MSICRICEEYRKPITFHCGMSWDTDSVSRYARPMDFEEIAIAFPDVNICLAHLGWPWTQELVGLLIKYPKHHEERFRALLHSVKTAAVFEKSEVKVWECRNCGHITVGTKAPEICPVCEHLQAFFEISADNF